MIKIMQRLLKRFSNFPGIVGSLLRSSFGTLGEGRGWADDTKERLDRRPEEVFSPINQFFLIN